MVIRDIMTKSTYVPANFFLGKRKGSLDDVDQGWMVTCSGNGGGGEIIKDV